MSMDWIKANLANAKNKELRGHKGTVNCLGWSSDGRRLASGSADQTIRVWSFDRAEGIPPHQELKGHTGSVDQLSWSPKDPELLATVSADKTVRFWRHGQAAGLWTVPSGAGSPINLAWNRAGTRLIIGTRDDLIICLDALSLNCVWTRKMDVEVNQMVWTEDEDILVTSGQGKILLISGADGSDLNSTKGHTSNCNCIKITQDGTKFVVGAADALITVWDTTDMACSRVIGRLDWPIRALDITWDGVLAAGSEDPYIEVASIHGGEQIGRIPVLAPVTAVAWNPRRYVLAYAAAETDSRTSRAEGNLRIHFVERLSFK